MPRNTLRHVFAGCLLLILASVPASATTFVVPTDDELIAKADAIVTGRVEGSYVQEVTRTIETIYEVRVTRTLKGTTEREALLRVASPGGVIEGRGLLVPGAAHFRNGDQVLLFLDAEAGRWRVTDMTLGKFRFVTSTAGQRLVVRDLEDVVGWEHSGRLHREKVRVDLPFLDYIGEKVRGRSAKPNYEVQASDVTLETEPEQFQVTANATAYPPATYTDFVNNQPIRWPNMGAGVTFYKRSGYNISGASDGGVAAVQNGLASWTNDCGSAITLLYGGEVNKASANHDATNVVEYNDPQGRVSGSWGGSGTIGITFISFAGTHSFVGLSWLNITDADVVFQDGFPATSSAFAPAMVHELGHGIGWRHSNQNHVTGGACDPAVEECTTAAIMNSSVSGSYGYNLQPYDINAARAVYPGGTCGTPCMPPSITGQPQSATITSGTSRTLTVSATGTAPLTYQWYIGTSGNTSNPIQGATSASFTVTPTTTTSYFARVSNACGSTDTITATLMVTAAPPPPPSDFRNRTDQNGDLRADLFWMNTSTGQTVQWLLNRNTVTAAYQTGTLATSWVPVTFGDFNGDGRDDVFWRNRSTGATMYWRMSAGGASQVTLPTISDLRWEVAGSGDFNNDGTFDVFWRNQTTGENRLWYMTPTSYVEAPVSNVSTNYRLAAVGDFDGDGRFDWFWRDEVTGYNVVWLQTSTGTVTRMSSAPTVSFIAASGDFNGDGRWDLFWRNSGGGNGIWLMNGVSYTNVNLPNLAVSWTLRAVGDFDGDSDHDLAWRNTDGTNLMWTLSGGSFAAQYSLPGLTAGWEMYGLK